MAQQFFRDIEEDKEELERLQDEISFYKDTIQANKQLLTKGVEANTSASSDKEVGKMEETGGSSTIKEVHTNRASSTKFVNSDFMKRSS